MGGWWCFIFWSICSLYWCAHILKIHQFVNSEFVQFLNRWWFSSSAPCPNTRIPRGPSKCLELFCCDSLAGVLLASSGQRPEMLVNRLQYRRQPLSTQTSGSTDPSLRNLDKHKSISKKRELHWHRLYSVWKFKHVSDRFHQ